MGFVLVDLLGEWLWILYNGSHLRFIHDKDLGVLAFKCEIVDESNFYCLFGASGGFTFGVRNDGYCYKCCFTGLLKMLCIYGGRNS